MKERDEWFACRCVCAITDHSTIIAPATESEFHPPGSRNSHHLCTEPARNMAMLSMIGSTSALRRKPKMSQLPEDEQRRVRWGLLFRAGLYKPVAIAVSEFGLVAEEGDRSDAFCVECAKESTVRVVRHVKRLWQTPRGHWSISPFLEVEVACLRADHRMRFYFFNTDESLTKIGQHPSLADIGKGELGRIRRVMEKQDQDDLVRADGLHAHGIGAGSFVYLRRIVERMVIDAEHKMDNPQSGARFADRIKAAREHLPEFLADNGPLYAILSKG
ncbi:MAG: hypothetical protein KAI24_25190, partial [Planctomycetes bacterium]|nr:hypothetical protein [Planctomycetota bacterium]